MKTRIKEVIEYYPDATKKKYYYPQYYLGFWSWDSIRLSLDGPIFHYSLEDAQEAIDQFIEKMEKWKQKDYLERKKKVSKRYIEYS